MTPHDDVQDRLARLAQRQDQLERQQRDTNPGVEVLRRDADRGIEKLRWDTDLRLKDMNRKVVSLERFREFIESLIMYAIMIGCGVALTILIERMFLFFRERQPCSLYLRECGALRILSNIYPDNLTERVYGVGQDSAIIR